MILNDLRRALAIASGPSIAIALESTIESSSRMPFAGVPRHLESTDKVLVGLEVICGVSVS